MTGNDPLDGSAIEALVTEVADFSTATEIVDAFYSAYPLEEPDEHLAAFIADTIRDAGFVLEIG